MNEKIKQLILEWKTHRQIKKLTGASFDRMTSVRKEMWLENVQTANNDIEEKITIKEVDWVHEVKYEWGQCKTKEEFFHSIKFDEENNEIITYQCNLRPVVIRVSGTETKLINKYEHFLRTRPLVSFDINKMIERVAITLDKKRWKHVVVKKKKSNGVALQINIFDMHINKKSFDWVEWNSEIAYKVYMQTIINMINDAPDNVDEVVLVIWQDFLNTDAQWKTTGGTPQDNVEWEEDSFEWGLHMLVDAIDLLYDHFWCKIRVISVPWNHARVLEQVMGTALNAIYKGNRDIIVDYKQAHRKYWTYGVSAVCICHGDWAKPAQMGMLFANERPDLRGTHKYKELHHWHIHTQLVTEINGLIVRSFASSTTTDRWHDRMGYVGNLRGGHMIIWDKEKWNKAQFNYYIN